MREGTSLKRRFRTLRLMCGAVSLGLLALASFQANAQFLGLTGVDVGTPAVAGQWDEQPGTPVIYNVYGGGDDIWANSDNFFYAFKTVNDGAFDAVVRVTALSGPSAWTKAELMVRKGDGTGIPKGNDPHLSMMATPDSTAGGQNQVGPQMRTSRGGASDQYTDGGTIRPFYPNQWLRIKRTGTFFELFYATNAAKTWYKYTEVDTAKSDKAGADATTRWGGDGVMNGPVYVGMAVTAHDNAGQGWAAFADWSLTLLNGVFISDAVGSPVGFSITVAKSGTTTVNASSAQITLDGTAVTTTSSVSPDGYYTTFTYKGGPQVVGSQHTVNISVNDGAGTPYTKSSTYTVPYFKFLPGTAALAAGTVDKTKPGFKMRVHQVFYDLAGGVQTAGLPNTDQRTERQLAGGYGANVADTSAYVNGWFTLTGVVNLDNHFNADPGWAGGQDGNFQSGAPWPGLGAGMTNDFAAEFWTALEFPAAGLYTMIVNSDDGFKVNAILPGEDYKLSSQPPAAGIFSGGRGAADTAFPLWVDAAGTYLFRATFEQGGGGGSMEWIVLDDQGNKVLINDAANPKAIKAYAAGSALAQPPYLEVATPAGPAEPTSVVVRAVIVNSDTSVQTGTIVTKFDGNTVAATVTPNSPSAGKTTITYTPPALQQSSVHTVEISFQDSANTLITKTWQFGVAGAITFRLFDLGVNDGGLGKLTGSDAYKQNNPSLVSAGGYSIVTNRPTIEFDDNELVSGDYVGWGADWLGYFSPLYTTNYTFYISADDNAQLWLSTDEGPGNMVLIAREPSWSNYREWLTAENGGNAANAIPKKSAPIPLEAGKKYFLHALVSQGGGGGNIGVNWTWQGGPAVVNYEAARSVGLVPLTGPVAGSSPATQTLLAGRTFTLTGQAFIPEANGLPTYQWYKGTTPITGATDVNYKKTKAVVADTGEYKLQATFPTATGNKVAMGVASTVTVLPDTVAPVASAGAVSNALGGIEVGVAFDEPMDLTTLVQANFTVSGATVTSFKVVTNSWQDYGAVKFAVTGVSAGGSGTVTVNGAKDIAGNSASTTPVPFKLGKFVWNETGIPKVAGNVVPAAENGFDLVSAGRTEWANNDEITFVWEKKTGDFDYKLQVVDAEFASQWARAGIQARESLDIGVDATDPNHRFSAYAQLHANPNGTLAMIWDPSLDGGAVTPANPTANNNFEQNTRLGTGSDTSGWGTGGGGPPVYPNVWLRLQRVGQQINGFRSTDGINWTAMGNVQLTNNTPDLYVGAEWAPESGNIFGTQVNAATIDPIYDRLYVAKFRNLGDYSPGPPVLGAITAVRAANGSITLSWTGAGRLQSSPAVAGAAMVWADVTGVTGTSYTITAPTGTVFYRLIGP